MGIYDQTKELFRAIFYAAGSVLILWGFYILAKDYMALQAGVVRILLGAGLLYFGKKG